MPHVSFFSFDSAGTDVPPQPKKRSGFNPPRRNKTEPPAKETEEHEAQPRKRKSP